MHNLINFIRKSLYSLCNAIPAELKTEAGPWSCLGLAATMPHGGGPTADGPPKDRGTAAVLYL